MSEINKTYSKKFANSKTRILFLITASVTLSVTVTPSYSDTVN